MKKTLLSVLSIVAFVGCLNAQTTYLDFEGATPVNGTFGGSNFSIVANPSKTGVNTSDKVAMTFKSGGGIQTWGGISFPIGGLINFTNGEMTFTMDVYSTVAGNAMFKVETGVEGQQKEVRLAYTTPGQWQTITYTFTGLTGTKYNQIVTFMGEGNTLTDVWYFDNVKGPSYTVGATVDATFSITDLGGTANTVEVELSNNPGTKVALTGTAGVGAIWTKLLTGVTGSTIAAPITYTVYVNGAAVPEMTNMAFAPAGSAPATFAKNYGSAPVGVNLITNGTFDGIEGVMAGRVGTGWGTYSGNGGSATVVSGVVNVSPVLDAVNNWNMQLEQWNFGIENGKTYTASFDAWSDANRLIALTIEDPANGYGLLGTTTDDGATYSDAEHLYRSKWNIDITTTKTRYERTLTVDKLQTNSTPKFCFLMAQTADKVYIDNVSLKEIANVSVPVNKTAGFRIYPNPATSTLNIYSNSDMSKVVIYNLVGKPVKEFSNVSESININDLKTGVYMIRMTDVNGKTIISKFMKK